MNDNQCIEHSISKNINEKIDIEDVDTNDYEVDLTAAGAYKRLKVRSFSNPCLVTLRELWSRFKSTPSPWNDFSTFSVSQVTKVQRSSSESSSYNS